jgi:predicted phosphoribosyltransferase
MELVTCLTTPEMFFAISFWYKDFPQTTDEEVCDLLNRADAELMAAPAKSRSEAT